MIVVAIVMAVVVVMLMVMMMIIIAVIMTMFAHGSRVSSALWIEGRFDFHHLDRKL